MIKEMYLKTIKPEHLYSPKIIYNIRNGNKKHSFYKNAEDSD